MCRQRPEEEIEDLGRRVRQKDVHPMVKGLHVRIVETTFESTGIAREKVQKRKKDRNSFVVGIGNWKSSTQGKSEQGDIRLDPREEGSYHLRGYGFTVSRKWCF